MKSPISQNSRPLNLTLFSGLVMGTSVIADPIVIAHRGASGYLPEHTLAAAAYGHALGADFIEQDLVMSRDDVLVVLHDVHLDTTTDVAQRFPERARADGRFYAIDFDWSELQQLTVTERIDAGSGQRVYPQRFPLQQSGPFRLCTMADQINLITGLNQSTGRTVGLYPEIKAPGWHASEGKDPGAALLRLLDEQGFPRADVPVVVQCFEPSELKRLRFEFKTPLPLVQLIGLNAWGDAPVDFTALLTPAGLDEIATYAHGIGPHLSQILSAVTADGSPRFTPLVAAAHQRGLQVHPYTFRADHLPTGVNDFSTLIELFIDAAKVDGLFTDHPDRVVAWKNRTPASDPN